MGATRRLAGAGGATIFGAVLATSPATALASLTTPTRVSPDGMTVQTTDVASGGGRTVILMGGTDSGGARLVARLGGAHGGTTQRLATRRADAARIAVGADGTAAAAWITTSGSTSTLHAALAPPGGRFGAPQTLGTATQQAPAIMLGGVAVTPSGRAVVAWRPNLSPAGTLVTSGTPVRVAVAPAGGTFGAAQTLGDSLYYAPDIAAAPDGSVVVAWSHVPDAPLPPPAPVVTGNWGTFASVLPAAGGTFGAPTQLDAPSGTFPPPSVSSGPGGVVVAGHHDGSDRRLVRLLADGTFSSAVPLPASGGSSLSDRVSAGVPRTGNVVAVWSQTENTSPENDVLKSAVVNASEQDATGAFSAAKQLSGARWLAGVPSAVALRDRSVVSWAERRGARGRVLIAIHSAAGAPWQIQPVATPPRVSTFAVGLAAASNSVTVTWIVGSPTGGGDVYRSTYRP